MARTWPVTRRKQVALAAFDTVARPLSSLLLRKSPSVDGDVRKILVVELWHMGDVVLTTPLLQRLRAMYPQARITLLAKAHAVELLAESGLVDEIVTFDFPWTAMTGKYNPARYDRRAISELVRKLKGEKFDLSLDSRMDVRSNMLTRSIGAKRRIGYDFGGGGFLLTDALPPPPPDQHKVYDWMSLLDPLVPGKQNREVPDPKLAVSDAERDEAARLLQSYGVSSDEVILGIHSGGSHELKRWPEDNFAQVAKTLESRPGVRVVVFIDPDGCGRDMELGKDAIFVRTSIREMMALLTHCDVLLCNDSGPMHVAAALGVPVVAVFRTGNPNAYGPRGLNQTVVGAGAPWGETAAIEIDDVLAATESALARP
jgi:heptosyltransferase II